MPVLNREQQLSWDEKGYVVFRNFFNSEQLDPINDLIDTLWRTRESGVSQSLVTHYFRRKDYLHRFWKIRRHQSGAYYYMKQPMVA